MRPPPAIVLTSQYLALFLRSPAFLRLAGINTLKTIKVCLCGDVRVFGVIVPGLDDDVRYGPDLQHAEVLHPETGLQGSQYEHRRVVLAFRRPTQFFALLVVLSVE
jgi:hypothetical protein